MKSFCTAFVILALSVGVLAQAPAKPANPPTAEKQEHVTPLKVTPEFERLRQLAGTWEAKGPEGTVITTYKVSGDGSAVLNFISPDTPQEMLTVFHPDGSNIMGTHYCSAHNQPRFVAEPSSDPKVLRFKFKDVTNLASPSDHYINGLVITFIDADHHTMEWSSTQNGKVTSFSIPLTRKK